MSKTVLLEQKNGIGYLTINRPAALNALSSEVLTDLNHVLDKIEASDDIRVVIVTGQGEKAFVAGADIKEMDQMSPIQAHDYMTYANDTFTRLSELTQPTIAVLNGYALGGGLELALYSYWLRKDHCRISRGRPRYYSRICWNTKNVSLNWYQQDKRTNFYC